MDDYEAKRAINYHHSSACAEALSARAHHTGETEHHLAAAEAHHDAVWDAPTIKPSEGAESKFSHHEKQAQLHHDLARKIGGPVVHDLRHMSHSEAYDHTQTSSKIRDGDVMKVHGGIAIMNKAWPVMVHGESKSLHMLDHAKGHTWENLDDGVYKKSVRRANFIHDEDAIKKKWKSEDESANESTSTSLKSFNEFITETHLMGHYVKDGKTATLWNTGQRQYELSSRTQNKSGNFDKLHTFPDHNHEDAHEALVKKGYKKVGD